MSHHHTFRIIDGTNNTAPIWKRLLWVMFVASIFFGPGILADSPAMQWAGFLIMFVAYGTLAIVALQEKLTIEQAREKLDKIETRAVK